ncbi:DUF6371 domain-containing protein [Candidatus Odyssella thessalonicensis]|uniref:DUF6371 domain-containing protein n=1 Tax=Candidatus Odyssella thessalonicensis TaxID=84647 RepID=UPI000225A9DD|nr:DUF6371 domain-containing protein [Candidatus Odyssella thessalonicensis]
MQDYRDYYRFLNRELTLKISDLAFELLGEPTFKKPTEWRYGQKGSLSITIGGPHQGRFYDFESGTHGSALDLISRVKAIYGRDLCHWARDWLGIRHTPEWSLVLPVPSGALKPDFDRPPLSFLVAGRKVKAMHPYRSLSGDLLGYVVRLEDSQGNKITPTLTYHLSQEGQESWRWKGFGEPRTPYGLEKLKETSQIILIVEGEKTADAAQALLPQFHVLTWVGGAKAVLKTDWTALKGRSVILWPDYDRPGFEAMCHLQKHLLTLGVQSISRVRLPKTTPPKWDLADPLPSAWIAEYLAVSLDPRQSLSLQIVPSLIPLSSSEIPQ